MKVPYPMTAALCLEDRHAHMFHALQLGIPRLTRVPLADGRTMSIVGYGPSLVETWQSITQRPILSMSGATRFLADHGIVPDYHVDMDPRAHKVKHLEPPIDGVHYLMATVCPPRTWSVLDGQQVTLWHSYSGKNEKGQTTYDFVARHDVGAEVIHGGSTIGLTALHIGGLLGYRHFEVFGMDGSFADETRAARHAGPHYGHSQGVKMEDRITWNAGGETYYTSRIMANAVSETIQTMKSFPLFCVFHGRGLTQALIKEANIPNAATADETEKAARVLRAHANVVDMPAPQPSDSHFWETILNAARADTWLSDILTIAREAESRRRLAKYNTGTIGVETAMLLRALCRVYKPTNVVEVGTFIGTSTLALEATGHIYTCDRDNDCLPSAEHRTCYPYTTSTDMLVRVLAERGERSVDLFFFDGRLQDIDVPLVKQLSHERTVLAFDDYSDAPGANKGKANVAKLAAAFPQYLLADPYPQFAGRATLAAMIPVVPA